MIRSRKDLADEIVALKVDLDEAEKNNSDLTAQLEAARSEAAQLAQDLEAERAAHQETASKFEEVTADAADLLNRIQDADARLETFDTEVDKAAKAKSDQYLARLGHEPLPEPAGTADEEPSLDILEQEARITDPIELSKFHKAHRDEIRAALFAKATA